MSTISVLLRVRPGKHDEFFQTIRSVQDDLKSETELKKTVLFRDMNDSSVFYLTEEWRTQDAMERYLRSERFSVLMGLLKVLCAESEIKYNLNDLPLELTTFQPC